MTMYYISKYNIYLEEDKDCYIYNTVSGNILKLSHRLYMYIKQCDDSNIGIDPIVMTNKIVTLLKDNNIIYSTPTEEKSYLEYKYLKDTYDDSFLSLVLLPTLRCNLRCHYCYEKEKDAIITDEAIEHLKKFFIKQSKIRRYIAVRWSGGEIMLCWNIIEKLSKHIISQCKINNCSYVASAISNGSLLTEKRIDEMLACNIMSIQITLDGDKMHHDKVRSYKNGIGTYDNIISNIEIASQKMKVIIRLNLDKSNFPSIENLFQDLSTSNICKQNIQLFCKPVVCKSVRTPKNNIFTQKEFYNVELSLLSLSQKYEIPYSFHWGVRGRNTRCAYSGIQGFYVAPNMKLYKCPVYLDHGGKKDYSVGYINPDGEMILSNYTELVKSFAYSPFDNEECKHCKVLPICHGKCPILWENSNQMEESGCISEKFSIEEKIRYALKSKTQMEAYNKSGII